MIAHSGEDMGKGKRFFIAGGSAATVESCEEKSQKAQNKYILDPGVPLHGLC